MVNMSRLQASRHVAARVLASSSEAFDTPLGPPRSLAMPGVYYSALRRLPRRDLHPLETNSMKQTHLLRHDARNRPIISGQRPGLGPARARRPRTHPPFRDTLLVPTAPPNPEHLEAKARHRPVREQPRGGLSPTDPATRAPDAALQVGKPGTTGSLCAGTGFESVPRRTSPAPRKRTCFIKLTVPAGGVTWRKREQTLQ